MLTQSNLPHQHSSPQSEENMDSDLQSLIDIQSQIEKYYIKLKEKELEQNFQLASLAMKSNDEFLQKMPKEHRKNIVAYSIIIMTFLILIFSFLGYCLYTGHETFLIKFIQLVVYFLITALSYFAGLQRGKRVMTKVGKSILPDLPVE